jgi:glucokinase
VSGPAHEIAVADIGGTNARFARAQVTSDGNVTLHEPVVLATGDYPDLASAWRTFCSHVEDFEPVGAAFALAGPVADGPFKLTNAAWRFDPGTLPNELGIARVTLLNDFEAIAHAVAGLDGDNHFAHLAGPREPLPRDGRVTVLGPGTGLGIAHYRRHEGIPLVQPTEGSHIDFAPTSRLDDALLGALRERYDRVSVERVISGEGIVHIQSAVAAREGIEPSCTEQLDIWKAGMAGEDALASRAVAHIVETLGRVAGDFALAHGAVAVVIAGGLGQRLREHLCSPNFHRAFIAKGRYRSMMERMPVKLITHPQPGLIGAALAFEGR